jgi:putative MATE family efflux protein
MAWPAILSLVVEGAVDVVDVALVGRLGRPTMAAWGYSAQCIHVVEQLILSVGIGCVALMSRAGGARDPERARRAMAASVVVGQAVAATGVLLATLAPRWVFARLDAAPEVAEMGVPYLRLLATSMLLYAGSFMFESALRANRRTRAPMVIAVTMMTVKTALSAILIFGLLGMPRLGLLGAGLATLSAHAVGLALYARLARTLAREDELAITFGWGHLRAMGSVVGEVLGVSLPSMGERLVMSLALLAYFKVLSFYGTAAIAAYAVGVRLLSFSWIPGVGFGTAASAFVGHALGSGDSAEARRVGFRAVRQALIVMGGLALVSLFAREPLARAFTSDARVVEELLPFMMMLAIAQPFMGVHFTLGGVLRGAGDTWTPFAGAAIGNWAFRVPLAWLFTRVFGPSLVLVWAAIIGDHVSRVLINGAVFLYGGWSRRTGATVRRAA